MNKAIDNKKQTQLAFKKGKLEERENGTENRVDCTPGEALELVWKLTCRAFEFMNKEALERPFQRHTVRTIRSQS